MLTERIFKPVTIGIIIALTLITYMAVTEARADPPDPSYSIEGSLLRAKVNNGTNNPCVELDITTGMLWQICNRNVELFGGDMLVIGTASTTYFSVTSTWDNRDYRRFGFNCGQMTFTAGNNPVGECVEWGQEQITWTGPGDITNQLTPVRYFVADWGRLQHYSDRPRRIDQTTIWYLAAPDAHSPVTLGTASSFQIADVRKSGQAAQGIIEKQVGVNCENLHTGQRNFCLWMDADTIDSGEPVAGWVGINAGRVAGEATLKLNTGQIVLSGTSTPTLYLPVIINGQTYKLLLGQ